MSESNGHDENGKPRRKRGRPKGTGGNKRPDMAEVSRAKLPLPAWAPVFFAGIAGGMWDRDAAKRAKVTPKCISDWKRDSELFRQEYAEAKGERIDRAEQELFRRGVDGVPKPVYHQGKRIATDREYSDKCLIKFLEANRRKYRPRKEDGNADDGPLPKILEIDVPDKKAAHRFRELVQQSGQPSEN